MERDQVTETGVEHGPEPEAPTQAPSRGAALLALQGRAGNQAVLALLRGQAKLSVGSANDPAEREADAVAAQVVRSLATTGPSDPVRTPETGLTGLARQIR